MDPNIAVATIRDRANRFRLGFSASTKAEFADEMVEAWHSLDEWLSNGGTLPAAWKVS